MKKILSRPMLKPVIGIRISLVFLTACSKEENTVHSDKVAKVQVRVAGIDHAETSGLKSSSAKQASAKNSLSRVQTVSVRLDNDHYMQATLSRLDTKDQAFGEVSFKKATAARASSSKIQAANPLPTGVTYIVVVYDSKGDYVDQADYIIGGSAPE